MNINKFTSPAYHGCGENKKIALWVSSFPLVRALAQVEFSGPEVNNENSKLSETLTLMDHI